MARKLTPVAKFVAKLRIDKEVTQKEMAIAIGLDNSYVSLMECGKRSVSNTYLGGVTNYFKLNKEDTVELFRLHAESSPEVSLLRIIRNIDAIVDRMARDREYTDGIDDIRAEIAKVLNNE